MFLKTTKAPRYRVLVHAICAGLLDIGLGGGATTTPVFAISNSETTKQQMLRRELPKEAAPAGEQGYMKIKVEEVSKLPTTQQGAAPANLVTRLSLIEEDGSVERKTVAAVFQTVAATTQDGSAATSASEAEMMKNAAGGGLADGAEHTIMGGNQKSIEHHVAVSARRSAMQETNYAPEGSMIQTKYKESMSSNVREKAANVREKAAGAREAGATAVKVYRAKKALGGYATTVGVAGGVLLLIIVSCLCYCFVCKGGGGAPAASD
mmetsp:Transcript_25960/g.65444  ORF Transcript_25960/g.65444 Transcript_25960/m.65444 type:complete len:265 (-) Transcript_25960:438-1232(-)